MAEMSTMERALWDQLAREPQTFADLWPVANLADGHDRMNHNAPGYRFTDRWLQKGRRNGWVHFARIGKQIVWSLTDAGRAALQQEPRHDRD